MSKRFFVLFLLLTFVVIGSIFSVTMAQESSGSLVEPVDKYSGAIDWGNGEVTAKGFGAPPNRPLNEGQKDILARRAAVVDAYRNLAEVINFVRIDGDTTVQDAATENDRIKQSVSALIKGARVVNEKKLPNGNYEVTVGIKLYGNNSLAAAITPKDQVPEKFPDVSIVEPSLPVEYNPSGGYTGIIVDCLGLHVSSAMSPKIFDPKGNVIYGNLNVTPEFANTGIAGWLHTMEEAKANIKRVGNNPLIIKAIDKKGGNWPCNPVISSEDAVKVLMENDKTHFLEKCKVCFLIDPQFEFKK